jgi:hypothetical protein
MKKLKDLPDDRTYDQNRCFEGNSQSRYFSFDLTSATDRFPIGFQEIVLRQIFNEKYSGAWVRLMTGLEFENPWGEPVVYSAGQPMGAYSS